ncbi:hypothetical protein COOONC_28552 [Cooperia oncophora]
MNCKMEHSDGTPRIERFPPEVTLHNHKVVLKWHANGQLAVIEMTCGGLDFCANIDSLLYAPVVIGKPICILLAGAVSLVWCPVCAVTQHFLKLLQKSRIRCRSSLKARLTAALAIVASLCCMAGPAFSCQQVNVLEHHAAVCTNKDGKELCSVRLTEVLNFNTFTRRARLCLVRYSTLGHTYAVKKKLNTAHVLRLCTFMTVKLSVKNAPVSSSDLIPELGSGNSYPGRTDGFEFCGGWDCDCASFTSGCLFLRLFAKPNDPTVYRIFRCLRWTEEVKLEIIVEDLHSKELRYWHGAQLVPNVPLNSGFITEGYDTAIWFNTITPNLFCESRRAAETLNCRFSGNCKAESKVRCECPLYDVAEKFNHIPRKLPVRAPQWELGKRHNSPIVAKTPHLVSSEFLLSFHETFDTTFVDTLVAPSRTPH